MDTELAGAPAPATPASAEPEASLAERARHVVTPKRVALTVAAVPVAAWAFEEVAWRLWRIRWGYTRAVTGAIIRRIDRL